MPDGLLQRVPAMPLPALAGRGPMTADGQFIVSRSAEATPPNNLTTDAATEPSPAPESPKPHPGGAGAASGDIHLLAGEVWALLKRRLAVEAERMGRS